MNLLTAWYRHQLLCCPWNFSLNCRLSLSFLSIFSFKNMIVSIVFRDLRFLPLSLVIFSQIAMNITSYACHMPVYSFTPFKSTILLQIIWSAGNPKAHIFLTFFLHILMTNVAFGVVVASRSGMTLFVFILF